MLSADSASITPVISSLSITNEYTLFWNGKTIIGLKQGRKREGKELKEKEEQVQ